jgi:DNA-binding NarL/FixJ family response regulator
MIVDDHATYRQAMAFMLDHEFDISVVAQAADAGSARPYFSEIDVAIVDLGLPGEDGLHLVRELKRARPNTPVLVVTASTDRAEFGAAIELGAAGVLNKSCTVAEVADAVRKVSSGDFVHSSPELVAFLRLAAGKHENERRTVQVVGQLTPRERDVLAELAKGMSDSEIAASLVISLETVHSHMVNILRKLDVGSRLQALVVGVQYGIVSIDQA